MNLGARADIRLDALKHNFDVLRNAGSASKVMVAVKANAYGHGLVTVSRALANADAFSVARLVEAQKLREAGIDKPIVLMGGVISQNELQIAIELQCTPVIHTEHQVYLLEQSKNQVPGAWLKIDTGMNRLGVRPGEAIRLITRLRATMVDSKPGLMTHLANSDDLNDNTSSQQIDRFLELADHFDGDLSIANSAAILGWQTQIDAPQLRSNSGDSWIRPGISLYGVSPFFDKTADELGLNPVMQFESVLIAVKSIKKGDRVGYGGTWCADRDSTLGIVAAGYGDGYSRFLPSGTPVRVNGRRAPLAGVISMDLCAVDLGPGAEDSIGDRVTLWGDQLPVEEIASYANTTAYPLVCGVTDREGLIY